MEPYCADLTEDNLRSLERMIKRYEDDNNLYKVPPLGEDTSVSTRQCTASEEPVSIDIKTGEPFVHLDQGSATLLTSRTGSSTHLVMATALRTKQRKIYLHITIYLLVYHYIYIGLPELFVQARICNT